MTTHAIILAAGKGTRMKSDLPKVLHPVGGMPMVEHLVHTLEKMNINEIIVVVGHKEELIREHLGTRVTYAQQTEQLGTAHAVSQTAALLKDRQGTTLVLTGDTPLIKKETLEHLLKVQVDSGSAGVVLTTNQEDPTGYGRILREDKTRQIIGIVEEKDSTPEQRQIHEVNTGIFCFDNPSLFQALPFIQNNNLQQEYYLTDIIAEMKGKRFEAVILEDPSEVMGINTLEELKKAERVFLERGSLNLL